MDIFQATMLVIVVLFAGAFFLGALDNFVTYAEIDFGPALSVFIFSVALLGGAIWAAIQWWSLLV